MNKDYYNVRDIPYILINELDHLQIDSIQAFSTEDKIEKIFPKINNGNIYLDSMLYSEQEPNEPMIINGDRNTENRVSFSLNIITKIRPKSTIIVIITENSNINKRLLFAIAFNIKKYISELEFPNRRLCTSRAFSKEALHDMEFLAGRIDRFKSEYIISYILGTELELMIYPEGVLVDSKYNYLLYTIVITLVFLEELRGVGKDVYRIVNCLPTFTKGIEVRDMNSNNGEYKKTNNVSLMTAVSKRNKFLILSPIEIYKTVNELKNLD